MLTLFLVKASHMEFLGNNTLKYVEHRQKTGSDLAEVVSQTKDGSKLLTDNLFGTRKHQLRSFSL